VIPSGSFVVLLFVIPAVVVLLVIMVWMLFGKLAGGERDAMEYVRMIRSSSGSWRSAYELASLIQNDPKLGSDPRLLGELTDLLASELDKNGDPKLIQYLELTLGAFQTREATTSRGQAVDPIEVLSKGLEPKFDVQIRMAAAASLAKQAARSEGKLDDPKAVEALAKASTDTVVELRQIAVYALGFFGGQPAADALRERIRGDEDRYVRYNAAVALGRRGDEAAAATLREMLSTADLDRLIERPTTTEKENKIEAVQQEALEAISNSISAGSPAFARGFETELNALTRSGLAGVRTQAKEILQKLQSTPAS
jgi:HEAT repeat protein